MIKFIHIVAVILFLGNIVISGVWRLFAERSNNGTIVKYSLKLILLTDWIFTVPGAILIGISGHMLAPKFGGIGAQPWIYHSYAMLTVSALIWLAALLPIQLKQARLMNADESAFRSESYKKISLWYTLLGVLATILPLIALYLMVGHSA